MQPLASLPDTPALRRSALRRIIIEGGVTELDQPVELSSGAMSRYFIDGKRALCSGADLALACVCILDLIDEQRVEVDAVGGLTMGADQFAHGVAILGELQWFVVRKQPKGRGTNKYVEGAELARRNGSCSSTTSSPVGARASPPTSASEPREPRR